MVTAFRRTRPGSRFSWGMARFSVVVSVIAEAVLCLFLGWLFLVTNGVDAAPITLAPVAAEKGEASVGTAAMPGMPTPLGASVSFPDFRTLADGVQQVRLFPGSREFVFTLYSPPGDIESLRQVVGVMKTQKLGNGFDPGLGISPGSKPIFDYLATVGWPVICYPGGEMQIKGGRDVLGRDHEAALAAMDKAGLFTAVQLGEWGYYFHNLSCNEPWWRSVYGKEFDAFKHLMKPAGLAGYDRRPASRQECYDVVKDYFLSRQRDLLGRVISVTGHSHYEAYVGEWGARCIGLEVGENIAFTQSKLAFARGASRQWQKPWSVQVSPWFSGACTTNGPLRGKGGEPRPGCRPFAQLLRADVAARLVCGGGDGHAGEQHQHLF